MSTDRLTEILNYLSAMSRDIGDFRSETKSRFDALETRVGGLEARFGGLEKRFDGLEARVGSLEKEMHAGFEQVRAAVRKVNYRLEVMAEEWLEVRGRQRELEKRTEVLERKAGITDSV